MDRFDTMRAFTRVVELNSFTKAAVSLNLPKATLSAQVAALEKRLNVKLLHRTTRHISVTTDGAAYYERAMRLLQDLEETESAVSQARVAYKGRLRVDVSPTIARQIVLPTLNAFLQRYPEIEFELGCTDRTVDLLEEGVDCAIRGGMPIDESLVARKLIETGRITCASPTYLEQHGTPLTLADLQQHAIVNYQSPRTGKVIPFNYMVDGQVTYVHGQRKLAANDIDACVTAALANIGVVQLPYFAVRCHIETGRLTRILTNLQSEVAPLYIVYLQNRHLSANVRAFVDWIVELFSHEQQRYFNCCPNNATK
jgi:LysR family transcriptional regulator, regulator for bpeEF and oprC